MEKRLLASLAIAVALGVSMPACAAPTVDPDNGGGNEIVDTLQFTVKFYDEDGAQLDSRKWNKDEVPSFTYSKTDDEFEYTFEGWATSQGGDVLSALPAVTADAQYYAIVTKTEKVRTLSFSASANTSESAKTEAVAGFAEIKADADEDLDVESAQQFGALYDYAVYIASTAEGEVDEVKAKLREIYSALDSAYRTAKATYTQVEQIKTAVLEQMQSVYDYAVEAAGAEIEQIKTAYFTAKTTVENLSGDLLTVKASAKAILGEFSSQAKSYATELISAKLTELKTAATTVIDETVATVKELGETLTEKLNDYAVQLKARINGVNTLDSFYPTVSDVKEQLTAKITEYVTERLTELKTAAISELDEIVSGALAKLPDGKYKTQLTEFKDEQIAALNAVNSIDDVAGAKEKVIADTQDLISDLLAQALEDIKAEALGQLDTLVASGLSKLTDEELKSELNGFYDTEKGKINAITDIDTAKSVADEIVEDFKQEARTVFNSQLAKLKTAAKTELDGLVNPALDKITDEELHGQLSDYYETETTKLIAINDLDDFEGVFEEIKADTANKVKEIIASQLTKLKTAAISELDEVVSGALAKLPDGKYKTQLTEFKDEQIATLNAVNSIDDVAGAKEKVIADTQDLISDLLAQALEDIKAEALGQLDTLVASGLSKLTDEELKSELNGFYDTEKGKINAITDIDSAKSVADEIVEDFKQEAKKVVAKQLAALRAEVKGYLNALTAVLNASPYDYIPAAMSPSYAANLVNESDVTYDFTSFVNVSSIKYGGFGEQWNMFTDNVNSVESFYKYLNTGDSVITLATNALVSHLDSEYCDEINYSFDSEKFAATLEYTDGKLSIGVGFKSGITVPLLGEIAPQVSATYDVAKGEKEVRVYVSETNKARYVVTADKFEFGLDAGIKQAQYLTYCEFDKTNGTGKIFETITAADKTVKKAYAEYHIDGDYVEVVGNKAEGMTGFEKQINELYNKNTGKLLTFDVKETQSFAVIGEQTFNCVWFNLSTDLSGFTSIKIPELGSGDIDIYVNGSADKFVAPRNTLKIKPPAPPNRKYDIELRKMYFHYLDDEGKVQTKEVLTPMMFINEGDNLTSYSTDVHSANSYIDSEITLDEAILTKVQSDHATLLEGFDTRKEAMTADEVNAFIG